MLCAGGCGACSDAQRHVGSGCYVGAWSTKDLKTWSGPSKAVTLPLPQTVPNVGASMVPKSAGHRPPKLQGHQAYMAFVRDPSPAVASTCGRLTAGAERQEGSAFQAINIGSDKNLSKNWKLVLHGHGAGLACPTARYNPMDQYYYVFGGGNDIVIKRSKDLVTWETRNMSMATHCIADDLCLKYRRPCTAADTNYGPCCAAVPPDCSPASGEGRESRPLAQTLRRSRQC